MKVFEYFKEKQLVFVLSQRHLCRGLYVRKVAETTIRVSFMFPDGEGHYIHSGYLDRDKVPVNYADFDEKLVFSSEEAAKRFLLNDEPETLPILRTIESAYNIGDSFFYCDAEGTHEGVVDGVAFREGKWTYHTTRGLDDILLECEDRYFKTREEAVENYIK